MAANSKVWRIIKHAEAINREFWFLVVSKDMWKDMKSGSNKIVVFTFGMVSLNRQLFRQKSGAFNFLKFVPVSFGMMSLNHWLFSQKSGELNLFAATEGMKSEKSAI